LLKKCIVVEKAIYEISPDTKFIPALESARQKLDIAGSTKSDIGSIITGVNEAALKLNLFDCPISGIRRKNIIAILEYLKKTNSKFSNARYNKYRSYLIMLFKYLVSVEAVETDPMWGLGKRKTTKNPAS
jgi:hypothetical protein